MKAKIHILLIVLFLILIQVACYSISHAESLFDPRGVSLFKDHRANMVGDILTIIVVESTVASSKGESSYSKNIEMDGGVKITGFLDFLAPDFFQPIWPLEDLDINPEEKFDGQGETSSDNTFATRMTAMITEVLPNGNLMIEGKRNVKVNEENQELVIKGIVRPYDVTPANTVLSSQIADAEIYYTGKGPIGKRNKPGILSRIFNWVF